MTSRTQWNTKELQQMAQWIAQNRITGEGLVNLVNNAQRACLPGERQRNIVNHSQAQLAMKRIEGACTPAPAENSKSGALVLTAFELARIAPHLKAGTVVTVI